ncbi:MAG: porin family protein [Coxiellaceae bacterium]|nr:porin family protein [Coxiellaceae bacterium]
MRFKVSLIFLVVFSFFSISAAAATDSAFDGFHIGAETGLMLSGFRAYTLASQTIPASTFTLEQYGHYTGASATGRLFVGYGWDLSDFYLGVNLDANLMGATGRSHTNDFDLRGVATELFSSSYQLELQRSFSLSLIPGYLISDRTMFFAQLGGAQGRVKGQVLLNGVLATAPGDASLTQSFSKNLFGWVAGFGFQHFLTNDWALAMQYLYTHYATLSNFHDEAPDNTRHISDYTRVKTSSNAFLVGAAYYFDDLEGEFPSTKNKGGFKGFYLGVFSGLIQQLTSYNYFSDFAISLVGRHESQLNGDQGNNNVNGGLFLGYGVLINRAYLGLELGGGVGTSVSALNSSIRGDDENLSRVLRVSLQEVAYLDLKLGTLLGGDTSMLYALVGLANGRLKLQPRQNSADRADTGTPMTYFESVGDVVKAHLLGLRVGLGFSTKLAKHWALGIQDAFTFYRSKDVNFANTVIDVGTNFTVLGAASVTPRTNNVTLFLNYYFS